MKMKGYSGPSFEELPSEIMGRIRNTAEAANKIDGFRFILTDRTKLHKLYTEKTPDHLWSRFGDFREVFVYHGGGLKEAHFRYGDNVYVLELSNTTLGTDKTTLGHGILMEHALGLQVLKRPENNQDVFDIRINGYQLEKIKKLGHQPSYGMATLYATIISGPYLGRR